jgi:hypothetical protein
MEIDAKEDGENLKAITGLFPLGTMLIQTQVATACELNLGILSEMIWGMKQTAQETRMQGTLEIIEDQIEPEITKSSDKDIWV